MAAQPTRPHLITRKLGNAMLSCAWDWGQPETIREPYYQILMTRTPDKDRAPSIGTGVFCVPFSGPGRFLGMLTATAKHLHHRSGSLAKKGSLCCLWESVCHPACDSSLIHSWALCPSQGRSFSQAGLVCQGWLPVPGQCPAWLPQPGDVPFGAGLTAWRYRNPACWFVARYDKGKALTPCLQLPAIGADLLVTCWPQWVVPCLPSPSDGEEFQKWEANYDSTVARLCSLGFNNIQSE